MSNQGQKYVNSERQALSEQKEKLREAKKNWNKGIKEFIPELIKFKQLINGHAEGKERIRLYDSFPEESLSKLDSLIENFNQKANAATNIVNYQNAYSKNYNQFYSALEEKRKQKLQNKKEASYDVDYHLISNGIHPIFLGWESIKSFFKGKEGSIKNSLMRQVYEIDQICSQAQTEILNARSGQDLEQARSKVWSCLRVLRAVKNSLQLLQAKSKQEEAKDLQSVTISPSSGSDISPSSGSENTVRINSIKEDILHIPKYKVVKAGLNENLPVDFDKSEILVHRAISKLDRNPDNLRSINEVIEKYQNLLKIAFPNKEHQSFSDYAQFNRKKASKNKYDQMIKYAEENPHDSIFSKFKKMLAKVGLKMRVFFKIKGNLEFCASELQEARINNNEIINALKSSEIGIDYAQLIPLLDANIKITGSIADELSNAQEIIGTEKVDPKQMAAVTQSVEKSWIRKQLGKVFSPSKKKSKEIT